MDLGLGGKRALVAAASRGLGAAIAQTLSEEGCIVEICSRSLANASSTASSIAAATDGTVSASEVDVSDGGAIQHWVDDAASRLGGLDIVIPNAGGPPQAVFDDTTPESWDAAYALTLRSALMFASASRPHLTRGGSMLYLTSMSAKVPISQLSLSGVFRAGVSALAKTLSTDWAPFGIRVNHLIPGRIATDRLIKLDEDAASRVGISFQDARAKGEASIPLGRYGEPHEFASAAAFLVSPRASYITGATLQVDGGAISTVS
ncbi:MAG: SDR family oxidoreductase [Actinomycetota bacterium]|nr:SDR family oxidoreductase [Actinomycetota bacterium]